MTSKKSIRSILNCVHGVSHTILVWCGKVLYLYQNYILKTLILNVLTFHNHFQTGSGSNSIREIRRATQSIKGFKLFYMVRTANETFKNESVLTVKSAIYCSYIH